MPLQHRHDYAAGLHRGLPVGDITRRRSSLHIAVQVRAATRPRSTRFEPVALLRSVQSLVPHVHLSALLAGPGPSGGADPPRRCRGCFRPPRRLPDRTAPSFTRSLRRPGGEGLAPPLGSRAPRGARCRSTTAHWGHWLKLRSTRSSSVAWLARFHERFWAPGGR